MCGRFFRWTPTLLHLRERNLDIKYEMICHNLYLAHPHRRLLINFGSFFRRLLQLIHSEWLKQMRLRHPAQILKEFILSLEAGRH